MKITAEELKRKARELGADLVGIAPVARWENAPAMLRPTAHLPEAKSVKFSRRLISCCSTSL